VEIQTQLETLVDDTSIARLLIEQAEPDRPEYDHSGVMRAMIARQIRNIISQHLFEMIQDGIAIDAPDILAEIQTDVEKHGYHVNFMNILRVNLILPNKSEREFQHPQNIIYIQQINAKSEAENRAKQHSELLEKQVEETEDLIRQGEDEVKAANSQSDSRMELFKSTTEIATDQITANAENKLSEIENANEAILQHAKGESTSERNNELENHRTRNQEAAEKNQQLKDKSQEFGLQKKETLLKSFQANATQQASEFNDITQTAKNKSKDELASKKAELDSIEQKESEDYKNQLRDELDPWKKELASQNAKKELAEQRIIELQQREADNTDPKDIDEPSV
jgi:chemotaxis protein histidine kinase CheA